MPMKNIFTMFKSFVEKSYRFISESYRASLASPYSRVLMATAINIMLSLLLFIIGRIIFLLVNWQFIMPLTNVANILRGSLVFDLSGVAYINIIYTVLMLLPLHFKELARYQIVTKCIFVATNVIALGSNIIDCIYYQFSGRRTTCSVFNEFKNEDQLYKIFFSEAIHSWYLVLLFILLAYGCWRLYYTPNHEKKRIKYVIYYPLHTLYLLAAVALSIIAMRGGTGADTRPITLSNAFQYTSNQNHVALILNTPFSMIRSYGVVAFKKRNYFTNQDELEAEFNPIKHPAQGVEPKAKNVIVIIMESFSREYIGALNQGSGRPSYTPFLDSLIGKSLTFSRSYANGRKSIDAMPSVLSSIPMFVEPFILSSASLNKVSSAFGELANKGFNTSYFHGARNGSMGFLAYTRAAGIDQYYGRDDYNNDDDFDGRWAIWDEEFFGYYASKLATFEEPFASAFFSASSHHPFKVPARYEGKFDKGDIAIHQCIGYSDNALRLFFERIKDEPYFENTLFVITADHTSQSAYPADLNSVETFSVPIILYHPGTDLVGCRQTIAEQIDIMPTILGYMGYDQPYLAFGRDLLNTPDEDGIAINYTNGAYQLLQGDYVLSYDGDNEKPIGLFNYSEDRAMTHNLLGTGLEQEEKMLRRIKAIIQQYMNRMVDDQLTAEKE